MKTPDALIVKAPKFNKKVQLRVHDDVEQFLHQELPRIKSQDPFYVLSLDAILNQHCRWLQLLPRVQPFYAVKCNPEPVVLKTLATLGCNFDCASKVSSGTRFGFLFPCLTFFAQNRFPTALVGNRRHSQVGHFAETHHLRQHLQIRFLHSACATGGRGLDDL